MRPLIIAAPALLALFLAAPATAQDADLPPPANPEIWDDDPYAETDETVLAVDRLVSTLLDMPVGRLARAMPDAEFSGNVRPGDTLREAMSRDNPNFEQEMRGGARALTAVIGNMTRELGAMLPELESWGRRMRRSAED